MLHNKHQRAEMTKIQSSICNQKAGAAARNTFPNPGSDRKVTIGYFISKVIGYVNFFSCIVCLQFISKTVLVASQMNRI